MLAMPVMLTASAANVTQVVSSMQKAWDETQSFQADFKQTVTSKQLKTKDETTGTVSVVKPLKIRWDSQSDNSIQILNGEKLIQITENTRRKTRSVNIYKNVSKKGDVKILKFLSGKNRFKELYDPKLAGETKTAYKLKLLDKSNPGDVTLAEIDKKSYVLRALTTESADSTVTVDFSNIRTNVKIENAQFEYEKGPKDVVHEE